MKRTERKRNLRGREEERKKGKGISDIDKEISPLDRHAFKPADLI